MGLDLSFLLGGGGGVRMPDIAGRQVRDMSLAQLARQNRMGDMAESEAARKLEEEEAYRQALPALLQGGFSREALLQAVQADPRIGPRAVTEADARRKSDADLAKTGAETAQKKGELAIKALDTLAGVARQEAQNLDHLSFGRINAVAKRIGVPLPEFAGDPQDMGAVQGYLSSLVNAGFSVKEQVAAEAKNRDFDASEVEKAWRRQFDTGRQEDTVAHQRATEALTKRGQDVSASTSRRGQDLLSDRQREANEIASRQVSPAALQSLAQNEVTLSKIARARELVTANPGATGLANYMPDAIRQRTDPSGVTTRALIADIAGQKIHDRSGAAVTVGEAERLRPYVPNLTDDADTVSKKLELFEAEYRQVQHELSQGKGLAEVIRSRAGEKRGTIGAAPSGGGWSATLKKPAGQ